MNKYLIRFPNTSQYVEWKSKKKYKDGFHAVDELTIEILNESSNNNSDMATARDMGDVQAKDKQPKED